MKNANSCINEIYLLQKNKQKLKLIQAMTSFLYIYP